MVIGIRCKCGSRLRVTDDMIGKAGSCPACHSRLHMIIADYAPQRDQFDNLLIILAGPYRAGEVILMAGQGPVEIGKQTDIQIPLAGQSISRRHCRIVRQGNQWRIEDLQSTNGVYVNNQRVESSELHNGDVLQIGEYLMQFAIFPEARTPPEVAPEMPTASVATSATTVAIPASPGLATIPEPPKQEIAEIEDAFLDEMSVLEDPAHITTPAVFDDYALHRLSDGDILDTSGAEPTVIIPASVTTGGPQCPSCARMFPYKAKFCPNCGIDLQTGRAILTTPENDLNTIYVKSEKAIRRLSWIMWFGISPIASVGYGFRKPEVTRVVVAVTILASLWLWKYELTDSRQMASMKNYLLWVGGAEPSPKEIDDFYVYSSYGDTAAYDAKYKDLKDDLESRKAALEKKATAAGDKGRDILDSIAKERAQLDREQSNLSVVAHKALPAEQQYQGQYSPMQLVTHAFLHDDVLHLLGSIFFLMIIGPRMNALVGNLFMMFLYPFLAAASGVIFIACRHGASPHPFQGASGAIAGLCGMYLILMPMHLVHMASWWRRLPWGGFQLKLKMWSMSGFWVVLFFIAFDVVATILVDRDGVAFWTHIAGFLFGVTIALFLLFARLVNCRGGDIFSGLLGMNAWSLIGKPDLTRKAPLEHGW